MKNTIFSGIYDTYSFIWNTKGMRMPLYPNS